MSQRQAEWVDVEDIGDCLVPVSGGKYEHKHWNGYLGRVAVSGTRFSAYDRTGRLIGTASTRPGARQLVVAAIDQGTVFPKIA